MNEPICKFNDSKASAINCAQFIYETTDIQSHPVHAACHHIGLIAHGSGLLTVNGESRSAAEGDIYFIKKGSVFSVSQGCDLAYYYISFSGWHADELIERLGIAQSRWLFPGHASLSDFWADSFSRAEEGNLDLFSEAVLLYTAAHLAERPKESSALAERIIEYADSRFTDPHLNLRGIAAALGYDAKYLSAHFKATQGITFSQYLRSLRIKHAAFLFEEGVESVKSVAALSGFSDSLYFSRVFRQETGITPSEYFRRHR